MLAWLSVAPFCRPVVPDVKRIAAGADGSMSRAGSSSGWPAPSVSIVGSPSTSPSQITTRSRRTRSPTRGASRGQNASTVNTTPAPESSRRTASSSVVSIAFADTAMAPSFWTAW